MHLHSFVAGEAYNIAATTFGTARDNQGQAFIGSAEIFWNIDGQSAGTPLMVWQIASRRSHGQSPPGTAPWWNPTLPMLTPDLGVTHLWQGSAVVDAGSVVCLEVRVLDANHTLIPAFWSPGVAESSSLLAFDWVVEWEGA